MTESCDSLGILDVNWTSQEFSGHGVNESPGYFGRRSHVRRPGVVEMRCTLTWGISPGVCEPSLRPRTDRSHRPMDDNETNDSMSAVGYVRVSTAEQAGSGAGWRPSDERSHEPARSDPGSCPPSTRTRGVGPVLNRPGLESSPGGRGGIGSLGLGGGEVDRLSRSLIDFAGVMERSRKRGWHIAALDLGVDTLVAVRRDGGQRGWRRSPSSSVASSGHARRRPSPSVDQAKGSDSGGLPPCRLPSCSRCWICEPKAFLRTHRPGARCCRDPDGPWWKALASQHGSGSHLLLSTPPTWPARPADRPRTGSWGRPGKDYPTVTVSLNGTPLRSVPVTTTGSVYRLCGPAGLSGAAHRR